MKFHIHMLLTCRIYLNYDSDCDSFARQFLVRSFFGGGRVVSICYYKTHAGPAAWNALPDHIRTVADPVKFRKLLKSHYFSKAFNIF